MSVADALKRARAGEMDYLAACPPSGLPVAIGGVDYAKFPGAGEIVQLSVHPALQSCGIGTILIQAAEQRVRARGLRRSELGVEDPEAGRRPHDGEFTELTAATRPNRRNGRHAAGRGARVPRSKAFLIVVFT